MELGGTVMLSNVTGRNFTSTDLTPFTPYTFRVAGMNINGTGHFSAVTMGGIVRFCERSNLTTASTASMAQFKCTPSLQVGPIAEGVVMFLAVVLATYNYTCCSSFHHYSSGAWIHPSFS